VRPEDERYFESIDRRLTQALNHAEAARAQGRDPSTEVEIPVAADMADRVENLLGIVGVAERVRELEAEMGREEAALELAKDFATGRVGDFDTDAGKIEGAVRTAVALLTEGVVAAPIEGIDRVEVATNDDGTEFVRVFYAGPIRSAGGTAQALSVLVADYTRALLGLDRYKPRADEIERYAEEVDLYNGETGLQYTPKEQETKFIAEHCPIMLDGEATGDAEVSGFRDLDRVGTNNPRGGMCLVLAEGIALKAPKIKRYTGRLDEVDWPWLDDLIDGTFANGSADDGPTETDDPDEPADASATPSDGPVRVEPQGKYLRDLIAGRPVFAHPSRSGGFRLRYGRARNHGFATAGVHPATMHLVDDFLATGTQIKTERPGKAAGVVPVDSIEGPTVKLATGEVRRIDDPEEALELRNGVVEILDLGEYLVNYGEFVENNHPLAPAGYAREWWVQDMAAAGADIRALEDDPDADLDDPGADRALEWAETHGAPLHPAYTYCWHDLSVDGFRTLADAVAGGRYAEADGAVPAQRGNATLVVERTPAVSDALESLLVPHTQGEETITIPDALPLVRSLGLTTDLERPWEHLSDRARTWADGESAMEAAREVAPFPLRERAPTRIGNRMGRPEKSEVRELSPAVHTLFPLGEAGGDQRDVAAAAKHSDDMADTPGHIEVSIGRRTCRDCGESTYRSDCPACGGHTYPTYQCRDCETPIDVDDDPARVECPRCGGAPTAVERRVVDVGAAYRDALDGVGERESAYEILKGVKGLTSRDKTPEPIEKGVLRAKHGVSAFKDGTVRYDMTDLPVTAVRPGEIDVAPDRLRELGYETDVHGEPLEYDDQLVHLRVQDVILSDGAAEHLMKTADFVDDLLERYYDLEPFYGVEERDDLVGELVFGMAPHTSAAVVGRVVGFTSAAVGYAHPYFHASKRRNCFHPDTKVWFEDEGGEWHYERIQRLVEERLENPREDDFGTLVQELDGDLVVPSVDGEGKVTRKRVEAVSKHHSPDHLLQIETRTGRALMVTPDHSMRRVDGTLEEVRASKLSVGDTLPSPKHVDIDPSTAEFDLLREFIESEAIPNEDLMIRGLGTDRIKRLFDEALPEDGYLEPVASFLGRGQSSIYNWVSRDSVPAAAFVSLFGLDGAVTRLPNDISLSVRRDTVAIDRRLELTADFAALLGYYAAEGFCRRTSGQFYQTTICLPDEDLRKAILRTFDEALSIKAYEESEWKITVSSRLVTSLFIDVLKAGSSAAEKRIPRAVISSPKPVLRAFLSGYFSGDGSASRDRVEIRAHTVSDELKEDLVGALKRFGITVKTYRARRSHTSGVIAEFYEDSPKFESWVLKITSENAARYGQEIGFDLERKMNALEGALETTELRPQRLFGDGGDLWLDEITSIETVQTDTDFTYSVTVADTHTLIANDLYTGQCDGDEDCVMLLMDGLLNFSKSYLPDKRGGKMDAPLVMSSRIDPSEIDDEAHNMDVAESYSREFYEATLEMADPDAVDVALAGETVETDMEYAGFDHTHDTSNIALGPSLSAYKTLGSMDEKLDAQLALARKLHGVDETDVAERIIEYHFLPDLIGNLRAFSRQETRCLDCNTKYRRPPLTGSCRECGGNVNLTVHEGSVSKYLETATRIAEEYGCREYTKQRLKILEKSLSSVFENDKNKQTGIADFM